MPVVLENPITKSNLTPKQANFCIEYVKNVGNGQAAALKSYNTNDPNTAKVIASENLTKPNIKDEIGRLTKIAGFGLDKAIGRLAQRAQDDDADKWALPLWFDVTGNKAPAKQDITVRLGAPEQDIINSYCDQRRGIDVTPMFHAELKIPSGVLNTVWIIGSCFDYDVVLRRGL